MSGSPWTGGTRPDPGPRTLGPSGAPRTSLGEKLFWLAVTLVAIAGFVWVVSGCRVLPGFGQPVDGQAPPTLVDNPFSPPSLAPAPESPRAESP